MMSEVLSIDIFFFVALGIGVWLIKYARRREKDGTETYQNISFTWLFVALIFAVFAGALMLRMALVSHSWIHWLFLAILGTAVLLFCAMGLGVILKGRRQKATRYSTQ